MFSQIKNILVACIIVVALGPVLATPTEEEIIALHEGLRDALNAQDAERVASYFLDDATYDYVPLTPPAQGKEAIAAFFEDVFKGFPDFHVEQRNKLVCGNILVTECTWTGTHLGEIYGVPGTGNPVQLIHMDIYEFEGDKIKHMTTYDDAVSFLVQFGVMPAAELDPALLVPSFPLPDPEPTGLTPLEADAESERRWNTHDLSLYAKVLHPDAEFLIAPLGLTLSRDGFIASQEIYFLAYPDLLMEDVRSVDMGDGWVLAEVLWKGTNIGPYFGLPATRRPVELRGATLSRYDADGLLTKMNIYFDNLTELAQLGLFPPPDPEANKAIVMRYADEVWNQKDLELLDELLATDVITHEPTLGPVFNGLEAHKQAISTYLAAFPDLHNTVDDLIAEGDKVVERWTATGTHLGELLGIPATGKEVTWTGITIYRFADGKIVENWWAWDDLGFMQQLGVAPVTHTGYTWGAPSEVTGDPGDPAANTASILYVLQKFWNEQNVAALDNTHNPDAIAHNPVIPGQPLPYYMYKQVCLMHLAAFPDLRVTAESVMAEADKVAIRWTATGTHQAELMGIPATGRKATWTGITIYRFADGKIVENWWAYDALGMIQQLTAPPTPAPATK